MTGTRANPQPGKTPQRPWWRKPFGHFLRLRPKKRHLHGSLLHRVLGERLFESHLWIPDRDSATRGATIGVFMALCLPFLQILFAAILCFIFRANIPLAILATFISNPITTPGILWAQYKLGQWMAPDWMVVAGTSKYLLYGQHLLLGSFVSALVFGLLAYPLAHGLWILGERMVKKRREQHRRHSA